MRSFVPLRSAAAARKSTDPPRRSIMGARPAQASRCFPGAAGPRREDPALATRRLPEAGALPEGLQAAMEAMSGFSLANVVVHRNSAQPARLGAAAFAKDNQIHLGPGQERHLPHEAWHVVQQAQGRVKPTAQMKGNVGVNDDIGLENEADMMGAKASNAAATRADLGSAAPIRAAKGAGLGRGAVIQRVVGPRPELVFRSNLAWALWFQAMTEAEVRIEATALELVRNALVRMDDLLTRRGEAGIRIPADYGGAASPEQIDSPQSPFRIDSVPAPVDVSEKPARAAKVRLRELASPISFQVYVREAEADTYVPEDRPKKLGTLPKAEFDHCYAHSQEAFLYRGERLAIGLEPGRYILFTTVNQELLGEELAALHAIRYEEPEPRSGAARAAADESAEELRAVRDPEAPYAGPIADLDKPHHYADYEETVQSSVFTSTIQHGMIVNQIVHSGPWAKGERVPSQMGVMAGQNAKNYFLDNYIFAGRNDVTPQQKREDLGELGGRFEWLHIIGSSLGGPNVLGNLVCGTYDPNTAMIALEHRVARWGSKAYRGSMRPTPETPLKIVGIAILKGKCFVAKEIIMLVYHGDLLILHRKYETLDEKVITKAKYRALETQLEKDIEEARGGRKDEDDGDSGASSSSSSASTLSSGLVQ